MNRHVSKSWAGTWTPGRPGLVVVAVSDLGAKVEQAMKRASKLQRKELKVDTAEIERNAVSVS